MQLFEELYGMLALLYPGLRLGEIHTSEADFAATLVEHSRYTTTLELNRPYGESLVPDVAMTVRAYHDARVAEVVAYQGCDRLPPPYNTLGNPRFVRDERRQVNRLLRQLLWQRLAATPA
jgi:uncharacterized protein YqiB (DUF1249 family)